ncbi:MAG: hypothetical protein KC466_18645, partial [Myxococcales bacterium]|nr:hypothetical protein [Myxococcales bacterium]
TAFYMFRLVFLVFWGTCRAEDPSIVDRTTEAPAVMTVPLMILAALAAVGGFLGFPEPLGKLIGWEHSNTFQTWLAPVLPVIEGTHANHSRTLEYALMPLVIAVSVSGLGLAYWLYLRHPGVPTRIQRRAGFFYRLLIHRLYIEEIYDAFVVRVTLFYARACALFDYLVIDGAVRASARIVRGISRGSGWTDRWIVDGAVNGTAVVARLGGRALQSAQSGVIQRYVLVVFGAVLTLIAVIWGLERFAPQLLRILGR